MPEVDTTVEYRDIQGFPGYRVGNDGSVWTCWKRKGLGFGNGSTHVLSQVWRLLRPGKLAKGHLGVMLTGRQNRAVHRLVLEAFVGPCPDGMECRHFPDRDPANNRLENLQWGTCKENQADRLTHGTDYRGEDHWEALLTVEKVRAIRNEYATGNTTQKKLGVKYGVDKDTIGRVVRMETWKHVT